jgi:hypothetical protein
VIDVAFLLIFAAVAFGEIVAGRNWRNLRVLIVLGALIAGNIVFHTEVIRSGSADYGIRFGIAALIGLIMLVGGRIVPSFTHNQLTPFGTMTTGPTSPTEGRHTPAGCRVLAVRASRRHDQQGDRADRRDHQGDQPHVMREAHQKYIRPKAETLASTLRAAAVPPCSPRGLRSHSYQVAGGRRLSYRDQAPPLRSLTIQKVSAPPSFSHSRSIGAVRSFARCCEAASEPSCAARSYHSRALAGSG